MPYLIVPRAVVNSLGQGVEVVEPDHPLSVPSLDELLQIPWPFHEQCQLTLRSAVTPRGKIVNPRWIAALIQARFPDRCVVYCPKSTHLSDLRSFFWNVYNALNGFAPLIDCPHPEGDRTKVGNRFKCNLCDLPL